MTKAALARRAALLALTGNALRPLGGRYPSVPAFFAGWLTSELAPHLLALNTADAAARLAERGLRTRSDRVGLAMSTLSAAGLLALIVSGRRAADEMEHALRQTLGEDYAATLDPAPSPDDLATPWRDLIWPFRMRNAEVTTVRGLPYAPGGRRFELDVYHHQGKPNGRPILLQVHGGGWMIGHKAQQGIPLMLHMAARGWVCVAPNYPLSPKARWPEHLIALKRAVAWIREHAEEYGADPSFIAVTGGSAGGHLATMLALTSGNTALQPGFESADTSVQACVPHYGMYDFAGETGTRVTRARLGFLRWLMIDDRESFRTASPLAQINSDAPPFFVIHGSNDTLIPVPEAREFARRLRAVSDNPVAYAELAGAQHAFDIFPSIRSAHVVRAVERFLNWTHTHASTEPAPVPAERS